MFSVILLLLYLISIVQASLEYPLSDADRDKILDYHNQIRRNYGLPDLVYDKTLEKNASQYAGGCIWGHSVNGGKYGENIAQYSKSPAPDFPLTSWMAQVDGWYQEFKYWTCSSGACSSVCGHLTQIVSLATTSVGCGIGDCDAGTVSSMRSQYMVCQYVPPGNVNLGSKHPVTGQAYPYSGCPGSNPSLSDKSNPVSPPPVNAPTAPLGTPKPPSPVSPTGPTPVMPTPVATGPEPQPLPPNPDKPWQGCKGDYWPGSPPKQKITPCNAVPRTFLSKGVKKLYCDVQDPTGYFWPVLNPGTMECNYVAKLEEDSAASAGGIGSWPYYYWIGVALGILVVLIIIAAIIFLVRRRGDDERV
jgi:hypothetical protein